MDSVRLTGTFASFRHARIGRVGYGGILPNGWKAFGFDTVNVTCLSYPADGAVLTITAAVSANSAEQDFVLVLGGWKPAAAGDVYALQANICVTDVERISCSSLAIREWQAGGILIRDSEAPLKQSVQNHRRVASMQIHDRSRVVQPLIKFRGEKGGRSGRVCFSISNLLFGKIDDGYMA